MSTRNGWLGSVARGPAAATGGGVDLAWLSTGGPGVGEGEDRREGGMGELRVAGSVDRRVVRVRARAARPIRATTIPIPASARRSLFGTPAPGARLVPASRCSF